MIRPLSRTPETSHTPTLEIFKFLTIFKFCRLPPFVQNFADCDFFAGQFLGDILHTSFAGLKLRLEPKWLRKVLCNVKLGFNQNGYGRSVNFFVTHALGSVSQLSQTHSKRIPVLYLSSATCWILSWYCPLWDAPYILQMSPTNDSEV